VSQITKSKNAILRLWSILELVFSNKIMVCRTIVKLSVKYCRTKYYKMPRKVKVGAHKILICYCRVVLMYVGLDDDIIAPLK